MSHTPRTRAVWMSYYDESVTGFPVIHVMPLAVAMRKVAEELELENAELQKKIAELERNIEDICIGSCPECPPNWVK